MSNSEVYLTRDEIEHPYANLMVMLKDKRRRVEQVKTVFSRITASPEVLAEKLVYITVTAWGETVFISTIIRNEMFRSREEAIAATVARLKEVCDATD